MKERKELNFNGQLKKMISWFECLLELIGDVKWKADHGFKPGFTAKLEELMEKKLPGCGIRTSPHIESRYKTLRRQYRAIADMLGPNASGFGWNDNEKMVVVEKQIFEDWVKVIYLFFCHSCLKTNFYFITEYVCIYIYIYIYF